MDVTELTVSVGAERCALPTVTCGAVQEVP